MKEISELYEGMLETFEEKTGFAMEDTADLAVRLYAAAAEIQALYIYADWALTQSFPQSAAGKYLDYHGQLRGITRKSCIELLQSWGIPVEERLISVDELFEAAKTGALEEAWCVGTAAVISPIGELAWGDEKYEVNHNQIGALSQKLYDELTGIQWGTKPDPFGWTCKV